MMPFLPKSKPNSSDAAPVRKNPSNYHSWAFRKSTQALRKFIRENSHKKAVSRLTNTHYEFPKYVDRKIAAARFVLEARGQTLSEED